MGGGISCSSRQNPNTRKKPQNLRDDSSYQFSLSVDTVGTVRMRTKHHARRMFRWAFLMAAMLVVVLTCLGYAAAVYTELWTGRRLLPWDPYQGCGEGAVPLRESIGERGPTIVGLYEEFPNPDRLVRLENIDFPVDLAVASPSREHFMGIRDWIHQRYPMVRTIYFWPVLDREAGYYPGSWSRHDAVRDAIEETQSLPVLWDLEFPLPLMRGEWGIADLSLRDVRRNKQILSDWLQCRSAPVHIWRSHRSFGLNSPLLRAAGMHFDPGRFEAVTLHLDLYMTGSGVAADRLRQILRCGVAAYGDRFAASFGVLNDGEGRAEEFVPPDVLERNLNIAAQEGVAQVWLFGLNGVTRDTANMVRRILRP